MKHSRVPFVALVVAALIASTAALAAADDGSITPSSPASTVAPTSTVTPNDSHWGG